MLDSKTEEVTSLISETVRRFSLHLGYVPTVVVSQRDTGGNPGKRSILVTPERVVSKYSTVREQKDANDLDFTNLQDYDVEEVTATVPSPVGEDFETAQRIFLSAFPEIDGWKHIKYKGKSSLAGNARAASDLASAEIDGSPVVDRTVSRPLGAFSGYVTRGEVTKDFSGQRQLVVEVYGKEQIEAGLTDQPALKFTVSEDGELSVFGPPSDSKTYKEMAKRGWAEPAKNPEGEVYRLGADNFWTRLTDSSNREVIGLLGDVHARMRALTGEQYVGFHWTRTTGATGDTFGRKAAVIFSTQRADDAKYLSAVESGDMGTAQKMVDAAAVKAGYVSQSNYKMAHSAPDRNDYGLADIKSSGIVPDDYWTHPQWYQSSSEERESFHKVTTGLRVGRMFVYRAVPKDVKEVYIRNGDWVTPSEAYARLEGENIPGGYKLIVKKVPITHLYWDANSIAELGYDDGKEYAYANTKNNRKLVDAVTYDNDGNVIPLSKRFNKREYDTRYSLPRTIDIDGTERPTTNSKGQPIAQTGEGVRNFYAWFKDSKVVDEEGRPKVMYHGTARDITEFEPKQANSIFVTDNPQFAHRFALMSEAWKRQNYKELLTNEQNEELAKLLETVDRSGTQYGEVRDVYVMKHGKSSSGANIIPLYVKAENPFDPMITSHRDKVIDRMFADLPTGKFGDGTTTVPTFNGKGQSSKEMLDVGMQDGFYGWMTIESKEVQDALRNEGFDSFYIEEDGVRNLAVISPNQIKSATGNTGTFSPTNPDIRYSASRTWDIP